MPAKAGIQNLMQTYYIYIMTNKRNGTLYTGMTSDLIKRVYEHKQKFVKGFTKQYGLDQLIYFEMTNDVHYAVKREKNIQAWKREWKLRLIEENNPQWKDLYEELDASLRWHDNIKGRCYGKN